MNNEPVAWLLERENGEHSFIKSKAIKEHYESKGIELIPLYMHPVTEQEQCPPASWWKGDPTCGGLTENYGLGKAQEK
jgi:hypothetical protein